MNGVALLLAAASLAVDYSWDKNDAGQVEYMVRVEPEVVPNLVAGEEIHSDVPAEAGTVERFRLRVGVDGNQPVFTPAAPGRLWASHDKSAMLVKARASAVETAGVSFGWQPDESGKVQYYVQIDPALLRTLEVGDEIQAVVDPTAGPVSTFVIFGGNKQLPRLAAGSPPANASRNDSIYGGNTALAGGTRFPDAASPAAATDQGTNRFGTSGTGSTTTSGAASSPTGSRFDNSPATTTGGRFGTGGAATAPGASTGTDSRTPGPFDNRPSPFNPPPLESGSGLNSQDSSRRPSNFGQPPGQGTGVTGQNQGGNLYSPGGANPPAGDYRSPPQDYRSNTYGAGNGTTGAFDNRPTIEPPTSSNMSARPPLDGSTNWGQAPPAQSGPSAAGNDRTAMIDPATTRGASAPAPQQPASAPVTPAAVTDAEKPWWWGWLVFACCALFVSIGANVYLGWTAVEFYQRYQRAVERVRNGASPARV
jgi:hypothetical protein